MALVLARDPTLRLYYSNADNITLGAYIKVSVQTVKQGAKEDSLIYNNPFVGSSHDLLRPMLVPSKDSPVSDLRTCHQIQTQALQGPTYSHPLHKRVKPQYVRLAYSIHRPATAQVRKLSQMP